MWARRREEGHCRTEKEFLKIFLISVINAVKIKKERKQKIKHWLQQERTEGGEIAGPRATRWRGAWVAQVVTRLTLGFSSGRDLMVCGIKAHIRLCAVCREPAWDSLSLSLSASPLLVFTLSLNK